jgi:hypothetical protein
MGPGPPVITMVACTSIDGSRTTVIGAAAPAAALLAGHVRAARARQLQVVGCGRSRYSVADQPGRSRARRRLRGRIPAHYHRMIIPWLCYPPLGYGILPLALSYMILPLTLS